MNSFIDAILQWFKKTFGANYEPKSNAEMVSDFMEINGISVTSALSERLSTLTLSDSSVSVVGDNARAKYLDEFMQIFLDTRLQAVAEVCLGTGDCIAKPNTDGKHFGVDIVPSSDFRIVGSVGDFVYSAIIRCDTKAIDNSKYERYEYQKLNEDENGVPYLSIQQVCFKNGKRISITEVEDWADIKEVQYIANVDKMIFGRFKCPKLNRSDINSPNGVPITFGNEEIIGEVKESWRRLNREFADLEPMIFADKTVFKTKKIKKRDANGEVVTENVSILPKGKERVVMDVNGSRNVDGTPLIHEFAPDIRDNSLVNGLETNLKMLEIFCGLDNGILSKSDTVYQNTDTIRKSIQNTFSFITKFRKVLESGCNDLLYGINILCNANNITPMGNYELNIDWSDDFAQSYADRFNELLQGQSLGVVSDAELRSWIMSEDIDLAKQQVEEINIDEINQME